MSKRKGDWVVGAVVLGTMIVLIAGTMYLQQADLGTRRTSVSARFRDVGNMQVGNGVVSRGVNGGRVELLALADGGGVTVELKLNEGIELPEDPVVLIQAATLFGEWQAVITRRGAAPAIREVALQLEDTVSAPPATLPGAVLPDIAQLTSVAGGIAGNVASVAERVRVAFDDSAARSLRGHARVPTQRGAPRFGDVARRGRAHHRRDAAGGREPAGHQRALGLDVHLTGAFGSVAAWRAGQGRYDLRAHRAR